MLISFSCIRGRLIFDVQIRPSNICRNTRLTKEGRRCTGRLLSWQRGRSDAPAPLGKPAHHAALGFCRKRWRAPQTPASPSPAPSSHTTGWAHASPAAGKRDLLPESGNSNQSVNDGRPRCCPLVPVHLVSSVLEPLQRGRYFMRQTVLRTSGQFKRSSLEPSDFRL